MTLANKIFITVSAVLLLGLLASIKVTKADVINNPAPYTSVTVEIMNDQGLGTGVVYSDGKVLTAHHVVGDSPFVTVTFSDGRQERGEVIYTDAQWDVAMIKVDTKNITPPVVSCSKFKLGEHVDVFGYPLGVGLVYSSGFVSSLDTAKNPRTNYQVAISATITHGNSGGPVFNAAGELVAIVDSMVQADNGPAIGLVMPMYDINPNCKAK